MTGRDADALGPFAAPGAAQRVMPFGLIGLGAFAVIAALGRVQHSDIAVLAGSVTALLLALALVLPWRRLPRWMQALPPLLAVVALALQRDALGGAASGIAGLLLLPVLWLALYGTRVESAIAVALVFGASMGPAVAIGAPDYPPGEAQHALVLTLFAVVLTVTVRRLVGLLNTRAERLAHAEQRATREATRLRGVLAMATDFALIGSVGNKITFFSAGAERMLGYSAAEVVGRNLRLLFADPDELARWAEEAEARPGEMPGGAVTRDCTYVRKDGRRVVAEATVTALPSGPGGEIELLTVARDVTRERLAERYRATREELLAVLAKVSDEQSVFASALGAVVPGLDWDGGAVWVPESGRLRCAEVLADGPLHFTAAAKEFARSHRLDAGAGAVGGAWSSGLTIWVEDVRADPVATPVRKALGITEDNPEAAPLASVVGVVAVPLLGQTGPLGILELFSTHARERDDAMIAVLELVAATIAHRLDEIELTATLAAARNAAVTADRAKSSFLARASHELRTPLNAILGNAQLIQRDSAERTSSERSGRVMLAGHHLLALVDDLIDIGRVESGELTLELEPVAVTDVLTDVLAVMAPLIDERSLEFALDAHDGLFRHVHADRRRLEQILLNVIGNAVKYTPPAGSVSLSFDAAREGRLRLSITDSGPGIGAAELERIWAPFERLAAAAGPEPGSGLGLALARALTEAMGGRLTAESRIGHGTTFHIDLRTVPAPAIAEPRARPADPRARPALTGSLLYIENDAASTHVVEGLFAEHAGVTLLTAADGRRGLALAREERPDLILLDANLPDMAGEAVLAALKADVATSALPVIGLSADASPARSQSFREAGAAAYMTKPVDLEALTARVESVLGA